jgi:TonB-linked SusC/RagA family outer membrane protein
MKKYLLIGFLFLLTAGLEAKQKQSPTLYGIVYGKSDGLPIPGANIVLSGSAIGVITGIKGDFQLQIREVTQSITVSFIGYKSQKIVVEMPRSEPLLIYLEEDEMILSAVEVVSTGFQELPAERATGSFVQIDNKLLTRRVSTNILDRLEDISPGLIFNRDRADVNSGESISIRGNSTLLSDRQPLIVVDNLAYDGPISNLNPNDVESITVLKDAAAASIWGARAGNGVIVIKTKSGALKSPLQVSLNSNLTVGQELDPFYRPQMDIADFVGIEQRLFSQGYYDNIYDSYDKLKLSPVVEDLYLHQNGELSNEELAANLSNYQDGDVRGDQQKYLYRPSLNQQYALNFRGGGDRNSYFFSLGFDDNQETQVARSRQRITLNGKQTWRLLNDKLSFSLGSYLIQSSRSSGFPGGVDFEPYDRLADQNGTPLPVFRDYNVRFKNWAEEHGTLNWDYYPLDEIGRSPSQEKLTEIRATLGLGYQITKTLDWQVNYQYWTGMSSREQVYASDSYYARNQINLFTDLSDSLQVVKNIPEGGIRDAATGRSYSNNLRTQLNFNQSFQSIHQINALAGVELKDVQQQSQSGRMYGFNEETGIAQPVNYNTRYPKLNTGFTGNIPYEDRFGGTIDRFVSLFANAGYTFKSKYTFTGSLRSDASNLYGVETNQRRVPLWSAGIGWIMSEESWMDYSWISYLKLKGSYGFNGNTNAAATAYTTAKYYPSSQNSWVGQPWLTVLSPPNAEARWEKIKIINVGAEFELWKGRVSGTLEGYQKNGLDLFGIQPYFPSSGYDVVTRNYANTASHGLDLSLNIRLVEGGFNWSLAFFHSLIKEKVTAYEQTPTAINLAGYSSGMSGIIPQPREGFPLYAIFSYPFAGLDPANGDPWGLVEGEPSADYTSIFSNTTPEDLIYNGSAIPTNFGSIRNQFGFRGFELSVNVTYRLGYFFKRETVSYTSLNRGNITHADYKTRWQEPGDELRTNIPSDPMEVNQLRSSFEQLNASRVRKGDHIRLQDVRLAYTFDKSMFPRLPVRNVQLYSYANNLGILWKAAKDVADPDFRNAQALRSISFGLNINF